MFFVDFHVNIWVGNGAVLVAGAGYSIGSAEDAGGLENQFGLGFVSVEGVIRFVFASVVVVVIVVVVIFKRGWV